MGILDLGRYKGIVFAITGFLVFIAIILAVNHGKAGQFSDDVSAVKFLAEQREQPGAVYAASVELAARLKNGEKIDEALEALRKAAKSYDNALSSLANGGMITDSTGDMFVVPALTAEAAQGALANGSKLWDAYKAKLDPILRFSGSPYAAPEAAAPAAKTASLEPAPVPLSPRGRRLQAALKDLTDYGATSHEQLRNVMIELTGQVETAATAAPARCARSRCSAWSPPCCCSARSSCSSPATCARKKRFRCASAKKPPTFCAR